MLACVHMLSGVFLSTLFSTGSCCIIYLMIDSHILPFTPVSPPWCPFGLRLLPYFPNIYLALTHLLLLIDLMSLLRSLALWVQLGLLRLPMFPCLSVKGPAFTMWGFIRSVWTALTWVMRFHYWTKVRDPSSVCISPLSYLRSASLHVPMPGPYAVTQHACAAAVFATAWRTVVL